MREPLARILPCPETKQIHAPTVVLSLSWAVAFAADTDGYRRPPAPAPSPRSGSFEAFVENDHQPWAPFDTHLSLQSRFVGAPTPP